jgi:hypothetical protein
MNVLIYQGVLFYKKNGAHQVTFKKIARKHQHHTIGHLAIRSNDRTKFKNMKVREFIDEEGIKNEFLTP